MVQVIDRDEHGNIRVTRVFAGEIKEERIYRKEDIVVISNEECEDSRQEGDEEFFDIASDEIPF